MFGWLRSAPQKKDIGSTEELIRSLGMHAFMSGQTVDAQRATQYASVYSCMQVRAEGLAQMTPKVYKRKADGGRQEVRDHWLAKLLRNGPSPDMDGFGYGERISLDLDSNGNHFAYKLRKGGEITELVPLTASAVIVDRDPKTRRKTFKSPELTTQLKTEFTSDDIFHVSGLSRDGLRGMSKIEECRHTFSLMAAAERHGIAAFENGAQIGSILKFPEKLEEEQYDRLQKDLDENWRGAKAWRTMLLESGADFVQLGINNKDSQFLETRQYGRTEICGIYRVPPHMIGDLSRSTNNNIEQQALEFVMYGLLPTARRIESVWNSTELADADEYLEYNADALIRGDFKSRMEGYKTGISMGMLTPNEARAKENMPADEDGDHLMMMANIVSLERAITAPVTPQPSPSEPSNDESTTDETDEAGEDKPKSDPNTAEASQEGEAA